MFSLNRRLHMLNWRIIGSIIVNLVLEQRERDACAAQAVCEPAR